jgi:Stage II sporulation protein E (SpoIIE)
MCGVAVLLVLLACNSAVVAGAQQASAIADHAPILAIEDIGRGAVPIDGEWQFHLGDDMRWTASAYDDSEWEHITTGKTWGAQTHPSYTGFAWYRRHLDIPPSSLLNRKLAILMPPVEDAYELFWNGVAIGHQGNPPPHANWYFERRQSFALPVISTGVKDGVLAIRVWKAELSATDADSLGGLRAPPVVGEANSIGQLVGLGDFLSLRRGLYRQAIHVIFLIAGIVALLTWSHNHSRWLFLWFSVWCLGYVAMFGLYRLSNVAYSISYPVDFAVTQLGWSVVNSAMMLTLLYLFDLQEDATLRRWTWRVIALNLGASSIDGLLFLFWAQAGTGMQWLEGLCSLCATLSRAYIFVLAYHGIRRRLNPEIKLVAIVCILDFLLETTPETIDLGMRFTHWTLDPWLQSLSFSVAGMPITVHHAIHTLLLLSLAYALMRYAVREGRKQIEIENELKSVREVQQVLIPQAIPEIPGYAIASAYHPAREVGGDFFQIIPFNDETTLVAIGDVSGKGLKAAMNVALIIGTIRTLAEFEKDPKDIVAGLNRRLVGRMQGGFATALLLSLDCSGHCTLANAGHLPPYLNGNELALNEALPLGITSEAEFVDQNLNLLKGDFLILYTDGVPEARDEKGELYGFERTRTLVSNNLSAESIAQAASEFGQEDDITVLTIESIPVDEFSVPEIVGNSTRLAVT